jgi:hypothetical protein
VSETRTSVFDAAACAAIAADYQLDGQGELDEDEVLRCRACGFRSHLPGTQVTVWRRRRLDIEPRIIELCEICNAAAGAGPPDRQALSSTSSNGNER